MNVLITRPLGWTIRRLGVRTVLSLTLLLVALGSVALELADLIRGLTATLLLPVAASGILLGWMLAKSPLPGWLGGILAFILGAEAIVVRVGRLGQPLMTLLGLLIELAWGVLRWLLGGPLPDGPPLAPTLAELGTRVSTLLTHVRDWSLAVIRGEAAFDPVATTLVWSLALWMAAVWASWAVRRRYRALQGIAPAGALLAISLSYTWDHPSSLWVLLGATLLLMVLTGHIARERRWQAAGTDFSLELRLDLALAALGLFVTLTTAAILMPSVSVRPIVEFGRRLLTEHLSAGKQVADSMGLEPLAGPGIAFEQARAAGLPNRSLIGSGPELSEQVVMTVYLEGQKPTDELLFDLPDASPPRYYWRAVTYDRYTGRGWLTGDTETVEYRAGEPAKFGEAWVSPATHWTLRQEVQAVGDLGGLLYRAGELVTADQDYRVAWRSPGDAFGAEIEATVYRADSLVPLVSEAQLRSAGNDYPDWVRDRYLALSKEVPERVLSLARDLTARELTPYDQARAIEGYLRAFTYTLDLPAPPPNRDVADYFLFDLQQGYCDYYATTMVVLARAAGLPARLVVGYAGGTYDEVDNRYVVTEADAHSWVEVYFPSYGWVEFEPTGGRPAIERPAEITPNEIPEPLAALEPMTKRRIGPVWTVLLGLLGGLASLVLGGLAWRIADDWRLRRLTPAAAVATLYQRLYHHGRRLAVPVEAGDTPYEFEAELAGHVTALAEGRRWGETLTATKREVRQLTDLYVRGLYSPQKPATAEQAQAIRTWHRVRRKLWLAWVWQRTKRRNKQKI